jgi:DNA-binding NtrC family response regulator
MAVRAIIVEDASTTRRSLRHQLERAGCEVVAEVDNAFAALQKIRELGPNLITLDIQLPTVNGVDALTMLEQVHREAPTTAVLVISGTGYINTLSQFMQAGAFAYLPKPVNVDRLVANLRIMFPELSSAALPSRMRSHW